MSDHLIFKSLFVKNFRSVDNVGITINFKSGTTTLVASTDNGSGKSTVWRDALFYALFDKPYSKDQKKAEMINSRSGNGTFVRVEMQKGGVEYTIERGMKPSVFNIIEDGNPLNKEAVNFQDVLAKILGFDERVFTNSVVLGIGKFVPFTTMPTEDRRKYSDQMLDLLVLTKMSELNKQKLKNLNVAYEDTNTKIKVKETEIQGLNNIIEVQKQNTQDKVDHYKKVIANNEKSISENQIAADNIENNVIPAIIDEIHVVQVEAKRSITGLEEERDALIEPLRTVIEDLNNQIRENPHNKEVDDHKAQWALVRDDIRTETARLNGDLNEIKGKIAEADKALGLLKQYEDVAKKAEQTLEDLEPPERDAPCSHCGGLVSQEYFDKHFKEYEQRKAAIEAGIISARAKIDELVINHEVKEELLKKHQDIADLIESKATLFTTKETEYELELTRLRELQDGYVSKIHTLKSSEERNVTDIRFKYTKMISDLQNTQNGLVHEKESRKSVLESEVKNYHGHVRRLVEENKGLEEQIQKSEALDAAKDQENLELAQAELKALKDVYEEMSVSINEHKLMVNALKDDGIKAKIVENYLPYLNERTNYHLEKMNFFARVELKTNFELEMNAPERRGQSLHSLSTGQLKRIDLAVLMAWRDVARSAATNSCNILLMDEILENLSQNGIIDFLEMWNASEESKHTNLIVISQRKDEFEPHFDELKEYKLVDSTTVEI